MSNLYVPLFYLIYFKKDVHTRMAILKIIDSSFLEGAVKQAKFFAMLQKNRGKPAAAPV